MEDRDVVMDSTEVVTIQGPGKWKMDRLTSEDKWVITDNEI